mgnify:FL=1
MFLIPKMFIHSLFYFFQCVYPFGAAAVVESLFKTPATEITLQKETEKNQTKATCILNAPTTQFYWSNADNLCWLDSVMTVLVNNRCLQLCLQKYQPKNSVLQQLYSNFNKAQNLGPNKQGKELLLDVRMKVFEFLKSKMQCSLGVNDSALASLNVLLKDNSKIAEKFRQECEWTFKCSSCGYTQVDRHTKLIVTFPNTMDDFVMPFGVFKRACFKCKSAGERSQLDLKRLPPCVMAHFAEGVKNENFLKSNFVCQGKEYELRQLIQYKKNPDHFVAWIRNVNGTHWAKVDDTQNVVCKWRKGHPCFPLDQVHIALWERTKRKSSSSVEIAANALGEPERRAPEAKVVKATATMGERLPVNLPLKDGLLNPSYSTTPSGVTDSHQIDDRENNFDKRGKCSDDLPNSMANERKSSEFRQNDCGQKRKNIFEPYIPKKKRTLSICCTDKEKTVPVLVGDSKSSSASTSFPHWKDRSVVEKVGAICDSQSDSGYSSPGSNSSCASLPSSNCTKDENSILNEIIDSLREIVVPEDEKLQKDSHKCDSLWLKSSNTAEAKWEEGLLHDSLSKTTLKSCNSQETISELDSLRKLDLPCDFAEIEEVSNCGSDIINEIDSLGFLENVDYINDGEKSSNVSENSVGIPGQMKKGLEDEHDPVSFLDDTTNHGKSGSNFDPVPLHATNAVVSSDKSNCTFEPINLPQLSEFLQLEVDAKKNPWEKPSYGCEDILEEIFPCKLLESCGRASTSELIDIKNTCV